MMQIKGSSLVERLDEVIMCFVEEYARAGLLTSIADSARVSRTLCHGKATQS